MGVGVGEKEINKERKKSTFDIAKQKYSIFL